MNLEEDVGRNWFKNGVVRKVGNDHFTSFWRDKWVENAPMYDGGCGGMVVCLEEITYQLGR